MLAASQAEKVVATENVPTGASPQLVAAISKAKKGGNTLEPHHRQHLLDEGFPLDWIDEQVRSGRVWSIDVAEAAFLGFSAKTEAGRKSSSGMIMVFSDSFAQLRTDIPLYKDRDHEAKGKALKYLTPSGVGSQPELPRNPTRLAGQAKVIGEGWKDRAATELWGGVAAIGLAGVSHYRKALHPETDGTHGAIVVFDADARTNHQVFRSLVHCAIHVGGKVALYPEIPGEPKGGACEYFKWVKERGLNPQATYKAEVLDKALSPIEAIKDWPNHWTQELMVSKGDQIVMTAISLALEFLPNEVQREAHFSLIQKKSGLSKSTIRSCVKSSKGKRDAEEARQNRERIKEARRQTDADEVLDWNEDVEMLCSIEETASRKLFGVRGNLWAVFNGEFHKWAGTHWAKFSMALTKRLISDFLACVHDGNKDNPQFKFGTNTNLCATTSWMLSRLELSERVNQEEQKIAFKNGTLDTTTGKFIEGHNKKDYLRTYVPHYYTPGAAIPPILHGFLSDSFGEEKIELIRAAIAMFVDPTSDYGKFLLIQGASGSGKGVLLRLIEEIVGKEFTVSMNRIGDLNEAEKRHQYLTGRKFVKFPDLSGYMRGLDAFYELVDNGSLSGRPLHSSNAYDREWNVRFAMASVETLQIENAGLGWQRRVIHLTTKGETRQPDRQLLKKLKGEIPEIISWALSMDRDERQEWLESAADRLESVKDAMSNAGINGNSIKAFLDECAEGWDGFSYRTGSEIHRMYQVFCRDAGLSPKGRNAFLEQLKGLYPDLFEARRRSTAEELAANPNQSKFVAARWRIRIRPGLFTADSMGGSEFKFDPQFLREGGLEFLDNDAKIPVVETSIVEAPAIKTPIVEAPAETQAVQPQAQDFAWIPQALLDATEAQLICFVEEIPETAIENAIASMPPPQKRAMAVRMKKAKSESYKRVAGWDPAIIRSWGENLARCKAAKDVNEILSQLTDSQKAALLGALPASISTKIKMLQLAALGNRRD